MNLVVLHGNVKCSCDCDLMIHSHRLFGGIVLFRLVQKKIALTIVAWRFRVSLGHLAVDSSC